MGYQSLWHLTLCIAERTTAGYANPNPHVINGQQVESFLDLEDMTALNALGVYE
jgi:hypothetical protein